MSVSPPLILGKSRVRKRARTDLCGGRSAMAVPTATAIGFFNRCLEAGLGEFLDDDNEAHQTSNLVLWGAKTGSLRARDYRKRIDPVRLTAALRLPVI